MNFLQIGDIRFMSYTFKIVRFESTKGASEYWLETPNARKKMFYAGIQMRFFEVNSLRFGRVKLEIVAHSNIPR